MKASFRGFMEHIIDYAGMFPPASLPLDAAARNYLRYRQETTSWMLGRFICPARRLPDLVAFLSNAPAPPLPLSVLASSAATPAELLRVLDDDLAILSEQTGPAGRLKPEVLEARIPWTPKEPGTVETWADFFAQIRLRVSQSGVAPLEIYLEAAVEEDRNQVWGRMLDALALCNRSGDKSQPALGFKIRCGGVTPAAFPTVEELALALQRARRDGVRLKATAGLHHPLPRFDKALRVHMHGFLNLFGAGVLAHAETLESHDLISILREEKEDGFRFEEEAFGWGDFRCPAGRIRQIRARYLTSFGSCSFDEPRQDLADIGMLPEF